MRTAGQDQGTIRVWDVLLASVLFIVAEFEIWAAPVFQAGLPGPQLPLSVLAATATVPLVWRRREPLGVLLVIGASLLAIGVVGERSQSAFPLLLALLIAVFSVAADAPPPRALAGGAAVLLAGVAYAWLTFTDEDGAIDMLVPFLLIGAAWIAGREVWRQRAAQAVIADRADLLRRSETAAALADERRRIARELHDVVAHGISIMGVQAAAARASLHQEQVDARSALLAVERIGRASLGEMRLMLGVLRDTPRADEAAPTPGIADLGELVSDGQEGGLSVELESDVRPGDLSRGQSLSVYRIVQEALTNARKHGGRSASVEIRCVTNEIRMTVTDDGPGPPVGLVPGHGLLGIRERAALHGGSAEWVAGPGGGFRLSARMRREEPPT